MRKIILLLIFIFQNYLALCQIDLKDILQVYKMDFDKFETFCLQKGFEFSSTVKEDCCNGVVFTKGTGINTKYITLYNIYFNVGISVSFQTSIPNEYLNIKSQLTNYGYSLVSTDSFTPSNGNTSQVKKYRKGDMEINIHTIPPRGAEGQKFEINLQKFRY